MLNKKAVLEARPALKAFYEANSDIDLLKGDKSSKASKAERTLDKQSPLAYQVHKLVVTSVNRMNDLGWLPDAQSYLKANREKLANGFLDAFALTAEE